MAHEDRNYCVVEFHDGLQVIPKNWFINTNKTLAYWPSYTNFKTYDRAVKDMLEADPEAWRICKVKTVLGSSDSFQKAKDKLKDAERITDINSDQEFSVMKQRRRVRAARIYSDEDSPPPKKNPVSRLPDFPSQPKKQLNTKISSNCSKSQGTHAATRKCLTQYNGNEPSTSSEIRTWNNGSDKPSQNTSQRALITVDNQNSKSPPGSPISFDSENTYFSQDMFNSQHITLDGQDMLHSQLDMFENQDRSQHAPDPKNIENTSTSLKDGQARKHIVHQSDTCELDCTIHETPEICNGPTMFQKYVVNSLIDIKNKLKLVIGHSEDLSFKLVGSEKLEGSKCKISEKIKAKVKDLIQQLPLKNEVELESLEKTLTDKDSYTYMARELKKIGGNDMKAVVLNLMRKIFSNCVGEKFSWYGKKKKQVFSELKICEVILEVVRSHYPDITEFAISEPMKDWLRHAPERKKKSTGGTITSHITSAASNLNTTATTTPTSTATNTANTIATTTATIGVTTESVMERNYSFI